MRTVNRILWTVLPVIVGVVMGVGFFTFDYAHGLSYMSTDPKACINCHVMQPYYDAWSKSSHHAAAKCVDCHLPHSFVPKYIAKADAGFRHSWGFTFQNFHEPIQIIPRSSRILQDNCVHCHQDVTHAMHTGGSKSEPANCVHCHQDVGHGPGDR